LYDGCDPEHTRFNVALNILDIKEKYKITVTSLDAALEYLHKGFSKGNIVAFNSLEAPLSN
jgi:hypothetical protein